MLPHLLLSFSSADHAPPTLASSCGPQPGVACQLVWDVSHNRQAAQLTSQFLAGPVHLLLRVIFVAVLALVLRAVLHRVINRLTDRAASAILPQVRGGLPQFWSGLPQFRNEAGRSRLAPGRLLPRRRRDGRAANPGDEPSALEQLSALGGESAAAVDGPGDAAEAAAGVEHAMVAERRDQRVRALGSILRSAASITVFGIASFVILGDLGISLAPLLASAGVLGVAVGFGAQNLVRDYLSGIFMLLEDQYGVGDVVTVGDASGTVETVTLRITRLRDVNGIVWHIRNGTIEQVGNESQGWARAVIDFPVPYAADLTTIRTVLEGVADGLWKEPAWRAVMLEKPEVWGAQDVSSNAVTMRMVVKTVPLRQWEVERETRARVKAALDGASILPPAAGD